MIRSVFLVKKKPGILIKTLLIVFFLLPITPGRLFCQQHNPQHYKIWYKQPASVWTEAIPIGNGSLGAMIFGGTAEERIQLNEESVWTHGADYQVKPHAYAAIKKIRTLLFQGNYKEAQALAEERVLSPRLPSGTNTYQTAGDLTIKFPAIDTVTAYRRSLDLSSGVAHVNFNHNGITYSRTFFSSYPDQILIIHLGCSQHQKITADFVYTRPGNKENINIDGNRILVNQEAGDSGGVKMVVLIKVIPFNGTLASLKQGLSVTGADSVLLLVSAATNYRGEDPAIVCEERIKKVEDLSYHQLLDRHKKDFSSLFNRVGFSLGQTSKDSLPTDERLILWKEHPEEDLSLVPLYFQFGRYLLISSSRPGALPANLQGIWTDALTPPWNADYHININLQMNYWPAEVTNLTECLFPLFDFTDQLVVHGRKTARALYHARGSVAHHTTDVWFPTTCIGRAVWGLWPLGEAWLTRHYWDHFLFSRDTGFLANRAYPVLKESSLFFLDYLVKDPRSGLYVSGPSTSPENTFIAPDGSRSSIAMGNAMDQEIITTLFDHTIKAAQILHRDNSLVKKLQRRKKQLAPVQVAPDGRLMEWNHPFTEAEPGHRHMSHLYGLYPETLFTWAKTPDLMRAAEKSLDYRLSHGGGHTGWSRAWIINFYARLGYGDTAWKHLKTLIGHSTLPNLFDTHPPFQIDGNFGGTAGIAEMLLQSQEDTLCLLPALPKTWENGTYSGLLARNGFVVQTEWHQGIVRRVQIKSTLGKKCNLRYRNKNISFNTEPGKTYLLNGNLVFIDKNEEIP